MLNHTARALSAFVLVAAGFISSSSVTLAAQLSPSATKAARAATFEVVVRKAEQDPLTYEKPLPMELLPYAIRSDDKSMRSILGTALEGLKILE